LHLVRQLRTAGADIGDPEYIARTAWATDELLDAIDAERPSGPFGLVTLLIGVNDQYRARPLAAFAAEFAPVLKRAVQLAGRRASRVVAVSIPDWGSTPFAEGRDAGSIGRDIDAYNSHAQSVTLARGAAWVDVTTLSRRMRTDPTLTVEDGLHPSGELYRQWAELAMPAALRALGR
jgi:lysophospholipase L1-like esterase